jgi:hypothetical protein
MKCEVCNETELEGKLEVYATSAFSEALDEGVAIISLPTRRNYLICDSCNRAVCYNCCEHARSGYCNSCIAKYDLDDPSKEDGLIREL